MDVIGASSALSQISLLPTEPPLQQPVPDLLIDIIFAEILPKLLVKSLLRFKAVCKSYKTLISSPEFICLHLRQSLSSDNRLLINSATDKTLDIYDLDSLSSAPITSYATFRWPVPTTRVHGSCNGLLLITTSRYIITFIHLVLLNPSTRSYINIKSTETAVIMGSLGLGFDCNADDYKIVAVSPIFKELNGQCALTTVTMVYSVSSKSWKRVDERRHPESVEEKFDGVLINNHLLHWPFWSIDLSTFTRKCRIGCFDVISEKWMDDVLLPDNLYDPSHESESLEFGVLDGCLFSSYVNKDNFCFDVWVMKEYGVYESWVKLFSIKISDGRNWGVDPAVMLFQQTRIQVRGGVIPVACRGRGTSDVLLRDHHHPKTFWWYNWKNDEIDKAEVPNYKGRQLCIFKESLVRLPNAKLFGAQYPHDMYLLERSRNGVYVWT